MRYHKCHTSADSTLPGQSAEIFAYTGSELTLGVITASLPVISGLGVRVGRKWSRRRSDEDANPSPDAHSSPTGPVVRIFKPKSDTQRLESDGSLDFGAHRVDDDAIRGSADAKPTLRHEVEYVGDESSSSGSSKE